MGNVLCVPSQIKTIFKYRKIYQLDNENNLYNNKKHLKIMTFCIKHSMLNYLYLSKEVFVGGKGCDSFFVQ